MPWGRSFDEYCRMFALTEGDLDRRILGCGDGPASFNAEATRCGHRVVSCDPIYRFDRSQIEERIAATFDQVLAQTRLNADEFVWGDRIRNVEELGQVRMAAMQAFLDDFDAGKGAGRYVDAAAAETALRRRRIRPRPLLALPVPLFDTARRAVPSRRPSRDVSRGVGGPGISAACAREPAVIVCGRLSRRPERVRLSGHAGESALRISARGQRDDAHSFANLSRDCPLARETRAARTAQSSKPEPGTNRTFNVETRSPHCCCPLASGQAHSLDMSGSGRPSGPTASSVNRRLGASHWASFRG